jgi:hypothetical protein
MSKHVSPLLGYNNNVRHKNRVFHIQTEDSGVKHPHIITHLFMDGGRILKSIKRSYAEHVGADKMQDTVKAMMKEQHKAMFIALRDGQFDHLVEDGPSKPALDVKDSKPATEAPKPAAAAAAPPAAPGLVHTPTRTDLLPPPPPPSSASAVSASSAVADDVEMEPRTTRTPELTLDISSLRNAEAGGAAPASGLSELPPPPANLFREKTASGGYRTAAPVAPEGKRPSIAPAKKASMPPPRKPASGPPKKPPSSPADARYAAARPAAIFGQARPQQGSSIFGEDLISDKSLDEVILSYLAEDLEPSSPSDKKK